MGRADYNKDTSVIRWHAVAADPDHLDESEGLVLAPDPVTDLVITEDEEIGSETIPEKEEEGIETDLERGVKREVGLGAGVMVVLVPLVKARALLIPWQHPRSLRQKIWKESQRQK